MNTPRSLRGSQTSLRRGSVDSTSSTVETTTKRKKEKRLADQQPQVSLELEDEAGLPVRNPNRPLPQNHPAALVPPPPQQPQAPRIMAAGYAPSPGLNRAMMSSFILGSQLRPVLETVVRIRFSIKTQRDTALLQMDALFAEPYNLNIRAPPDDQLIDTTVSAAADFINKIYTGLDIGEREGEVTNNMDDKKLSVLKSAQELLKLMLITTPARAATYGIFTREEFEKKFALRPAA